MGESFAFWWLFDYPAAMHVLDDLLALAPNDVYGNLFRGSSRLLHGSSRAAGAVDLDWAITLAPQSPDVRFIVADAYTYGYAPDPQRAFDEATRALDGGLDTPRIHAILASAYLAFGNLAAAAEQIDIHIRLVTTELVATSPLPAGSSMSLGLVRAGRTRFRSRRVPAKRSRSRRAARISGTRFSSCSLPTGHRSSAATTTRRTSRDFSGPRRPRGRTGSG